MANCYLLYIMGRIDVSMAYWFNESKNYKLIYAIGCFVLGVVISIFAGNDYRMAILFASDAVYSSYGELLIAIIISLSGIIVLFNRDIRIHPLICILMIIFQVWGYFFCKKYEMTDRISVLKWFSLALAPFTVFLLENKNNNDNAATDRSYIVPVSIIVVKSIQSFMLIAMGMVALFQCGILFADNIYFNHKTLVWSLFMFIGLVMLIDGILIACFKNRRINKPCALFIILSLFSGVVSILIQGVTGAISLFVYILLMIIVAITETSFFIKKNSKE